ncbi:MAG: hypothetical protein Q4D96_04950 [Propionibacteriaceae bacterium]|nr:hypothetical protein [Propionibacteriaceae bacterium]
MKAVTRIALVALTASLAACSGGTAEPADSPSPSSPLTRMVPASTPAPTSDESEDIAPVTVPETHLAAIRADLEQRGVAGDKAQVAEARRVTWNNGALGCGEPGATYTQAQVEGWHVIVSVDGQSYDYRFGKDATPTLCERPSIPQPSNPNS